jgi:hypothetical protein
MAERTAIEGQKITPVPRRTKQPRKRVAIILDGFVLGVSMQQMGKIFAADKISLFFLASW